ncbi:MAG: helicase C-terminal domain-containing protein [Eubacteriales bacterium]
MIQQSGMRETEREAFLSRYQEPAGTRSLLGFCVLGGIFSEGIDLKGESLIGAAIVGTGLPESAMSGRFCGSTTRDGRWTASPTPTAIRV